MKVAAACCALLTLSACANAPSPAAAPEPASSPVFDLTVPLSVAAFKMTKRHDYEEAGAGVQLRYEGPENLIADVFVYPGPDLASKCPLACASKLLAAEVAGFEGSIPEIIRRGFVQSAKITATETLVPPSAGPWQVGHHLTLAVMRDSLAQRSEFYLFYLPNFRVKVRATFTESEAHLRNISAFVTALVPVLVERVAPPT